MNSFWGIYLVILGIFLAVFNKRVARSTIAFWSEITYYEKYRHIIELGFLICGILFVLFGILFILKPSLLD